MILSMEQTHIITNKYFLKFRVAWNSGKILPLKEKILRSLKERNIILFTTVSPGTKLVTKT